MSTAEGCSHIHPELHSAIHQLHCTIGAAMMDDKFELPPTLLQYLADSELEVVSWDGSTLVLKVRKEIGPEDGLLTFTGVSHVNLPPMLTIEGIQIAPPDQIPRSHFEMYRPSDKRLDDNERLFVIAGSWGERFFVVASNVEYLTTR